MRVALLRPLLGTDLSRLNFCPEDYGRAVAKRQEELTAAGNEEMASIIETRTAAYISDKADALGVSVTVRVRTEPGEGGVPIPFRVELTGPRSEALAAYMEGELGIPQERQVWYDEED